MAHDWPDTHRQRGARFRLFREGNSELRGLDDRGRYRHGHHRPRAAAGLLQRRQPAAGPRGRARARHGHSRRARRRPGAAHAARRDRGVRDCRAWRASRPGARVVDARRSSASFAIPIEQPQHIDLTPNATVVGFILVLVVIAGVLPGLWPAVAAARVDVLRVLGSQGGSATGAKAVADAPRWLVGAQIAGSTAFLAIAALFAQSYGNAFARRPGLRPGPAGRRRVRAGVSRLRRGSVRALRGRAARARAGAAGRRRRGAGRPRRRSSSASIG